MMRKQQSSSVKSKIIPAETALDQCVDGSTNQTELSVIRPTVNAARQQDCQHSVSKRSPTRRFANLRQHQLAGRKQRGRKPHEPSFTEAVGSLLTAPAAGTHQVAAVTALASLRSRARLNRRPVRADSRGLKQRQRRRSIKSANQPGKPFTVAHITGVTWGNDLPSGGARHRRRGPRLRRFGARRRRREARHRGPGA